MWDDFVRSVPSELAAALLGALAIAVVIEFWRILRRFYRRICEFFGARRKLRKFDREITRVRRAGRWNRVVEARERRLQQKIGSSIPILLVANHKGGVGKTTLSANLGGAWARDFGKRVLWVDLDFQGTLSSTLTRLGHVADVSENAPNLAKVFLEGGDTRSIEQVFDKRRRLRGDLENCAFYEAWEGFADLEDWLMMKWVGQRSRGDVRFRLARFLHSEVVQNSFDVVILDAPPRNTTGGVNGLCACTDIVIPTRADRFSCAGARLFLETTSLDHDLLAPQAKMQGIVRTLVAQTEQDDATALNELLEGIRKSPLSKRETGAQYVIPKFWPENSRFDVIGKVPIRRSIANDTATNITYLVDSEIRTMFKPIAQEIGMRIGLLYESSDRET